MVAAAVVLCGINKTALIGFEIQRLNLHTSIGACALCAFACHLHFAIHFMVIVDVDGLDFIDRS